MYFDSGVWTWHVDTEPATIDPEKKGQAAEEMLDL
jgi:hypothetical protein